MRAGLRRLWRAGVLVLGLRRRRFRLGGRRFCDFRLGRLGCLGRRRGLVGSGRGLARFECTQLGDILRMLVERLGNWAEAGSHHTIFSVRGVWDVSKLELIGKEVIPQIRSLGEPSPLGEPLPLNDLSPVGDG